MAFSEKMKKSKNFVLIVALVTVLVKAILQTLMKTFFKFPFPDINHNCITIL